MEASFLSHQICSHRKESDHRSSLSRNIPGESHVWNNKPRGFGFGTDIAIFLSTCELRSFWDVAWAMSIKWSRNHCSEICGSELGTESTCITHTAITVKYVCNYLNFKFQPFQLRSLRYSDSSLRYSDSSRSSPVAWDTQILAWDTQFLAWDTQIPAVPAPSLEILRF